MDRKDRLMFAATKPRQAIFISCAADGFLPIFFTLAVGLLDVSLSLQPNTHDCRQGTSYALGRCTIEKGFVQRRSMLDVEILVSQTCLTRISPDWLPGHETTLSHH